MPDSDLDYYCLNCGSHIGKNATPDQIQKHMKQHEDTSRLKTRAQYLQEH